MFVDNEATCAALAQGAAENRMAFMSVSAAWSVAARYNVAIRIGMASSKLIRTDLPSGGQELPSAAEPSKELPSLEDTYGLSDLLRTVKAPRISQSLLSPSA